MSMDYVHGNLRNIHCGGVGIVSLVYAAVRDRDWGTVPPLLTGQNIHEYRDGCSH